MGIKVASDPPLAETTASDDKRTSRTDQSVRGANWGAKLHTHQRTVTDTSGTQPLKSRGIWTVTNIDGRFRDALQAGGQGFDSPQLH
jgi:hypothetical protein